MEMNNMQSCIDACTKCYQTCLKTAMSHCLDAGGKHTDPDHFRLMINCSQVCQTSVDLQLSGSTFCAEYCALCAQVCDACADSCSELADMDDCEKICRDCANSCRAMANH